jgi:membrane protein YqaA with SNARE-associated domain
MPVCRPRLPHNELSMHAHLRALLAFLFHLGPLGLLILGVLDSSFFFLPFGNDLLLVVLVARHHAYLPFYVLTASLGSAGGVLLLDLVCRKGGDESLKKMMSRRRHNYLKKRMSQNAAAPVMVACLAPPPFPFTAVIAAASAFQYPKLRLLLYVFVARAVRFTLIGLLAIEFGRRILRIAASPEFTWFVVGFSALCIIGSAISIMRWVRLSR